MASNILIAVLDYRVATPAKSRLKRATEATALDMLPSVDVLGALRVAANGQRFLGFAAEADNVDANGRGKLEAKQLDFLFANPVARDGEASQPRFSVPTNAATLFRRNTEALSLPLMSKAELARHLWDAVL